MLKKSLFVLAFGLLACSARASDMDQPEFTLQVQADPSPAKADQATTYTLSIQPKGDYVLKTETPFKLSLSSDDKVKLSKSKFGSDDLEKAGKGRQIKTTFSASSGKHEINADLTFFLCTEEMCRRFKAKPTLEVTAQ